MARFGILCPPGGGHLNPMITLGRELQRRGHDVTLFGMLDTQSKAIAAGLGFWTLGEKEYPAGGVAQELARLGQLSGLAAMQYTLYHYKRMANVVLRDAPKGIKEIGVEALLIDQTMLEGGTVADYLNIPFITICNALMLNSEPGLPPIFLPWSYSTSRWKRLRNQISSTLLSFVLLGSGGLSLARLIQKHRRYWKLPAYSVSDNPYSHLAQLSQQPFEFEFPRDCLPEYFHFTGPYLNPATRQPVAFPYEKLTGQPLIYASLGTVQNRLMWVFHKIAEACARIDVQLVISLGGSGNSESLPKLPGNPLVVEFAPQLELLKKASITITHAGLNTTLESLNNGVPMVAIPIANDQSGVAARIAWTGTGEIVPLDCLSVSKLQTAIERVLTENSYKKNALKLQEAIKRAGGVSRAADIVEQVVRTGKPVYR